MEIKVGDIVGYIRRSTDVETGKESFRYVEGKIKSIYCGKRSHTVKADGFYPLDYDELVSNTQIISGGKLIFVGEPFIVKDESVSEHMKAVADYYNKNGAKSILEE